MAKLWNNAIVYSGTDAELAADTKIYNNNNIIFSEDTGVFKRGNNADVYSALLAIGGGNGGEPIEVPKDINDESLQLVGETSATLNAKFPTSKPGDSYYSVVNEVRFTKLEGDVWDQQGLTLI